MKWEYKVHDTAITKEILADYGNRGYELIEVRQSHYSTPPIYYFKKPKKEDKRDKEDGWFAKLVDNFMTYPY